MPVREKGAEAPQGNGAKAQTRKTQPTTGEDAWDDIMSMQSGGGNDGEFNKMNTSFWLKDGEEIDVVILDDNPYIFLGHNVKCQSQAGKTFYRTEQCQKANSDSCIMCDSKSKAISKARQVIAFRILDSRGTYTNGGFDQKPVPKIFLVPLYLGKVLKNLMDDAGGKLSDKVLKMSKSGNYIATFKMTRNQNGTMSFNPAPDVSSMDLPEVLKVYAPMNDDDLTDFLHQFADMGTGQQQQNNQAQAPQNSRQQGSGNFGSFGS